MKEVFNSSFCFFLQEILDQIADIDLVLNLRCTEECVVNKKTLGGSIYSPCLDLHSMATSGINLSLETQAGHPCAHSDTLWKKEKSSLFAEQVPRRHLLHLNNTRGWFCSVLFRAWGEVRKLGPFWKQVNIQHRRIVGYENIIV